MVIAIFIFSIVLGMVSKFCTRKRKDEKDKYRQVNRGKDPRKVERISSRGIARKTRGSKRRCGLFKELKEIPFGTSITIGPRSIGS